MKQDPKDREIFNPDLQWFILCAEAALGARGTLGSVVATLERGGAPSGGDFEHITNEQIGWVAGEGTTERARRLQVLWDRLEPPTRHVLCGHYTPRNGLPEQHRSRVEGALGVFANAVLWLEEDEALAKLIGACVDSNTEGRKGIIEGARKRAEGKVRAAHRAWHGLIAADVAEAKRAAEPPPPPRPPDPLPGESWLDVARWMTRHGAKRATP